MIELGKFAKQFLSRATSHVMRWHHRHAAWKESLSEHHALTARMSYELGWLVQDLGICDLDTVRPEAIMRAALYHDEPEIVTGDIPASAKALIPGVREAVQRWEETAMSLLWEHYPERLQARLRSVVRREDLSEIERQILHYADGMSAYAYARDQVIMGNQYFEDIVAYTEGPDYLGKLRYPWLLKLRSLTGLP